MSKGSQKNFAEFAEKIGPAWQKNPNEFNEAYYRQTIAKAIAFKETEDIVTVQPWYQGGGIRSRVVPYAIAKLAYDAQLRGRFVDFEEIWRKQALSEKLRAALTLASEKVHAVILGSQSEVQNPLEWAKQQACWNRVKMLVIEWPNKWMETLTTAKHQIEDKRAGVKEQKVLNSLEAELAVFNAGAEFWKAAKEWATKKQLLSATEAGILEVAASMPLRIPSDKQSVRTLEILRKLHAEGYQPGTDMFA